jgi:hypothetical protein
MIARNVASILPRHPPGSRENVSILASIIAEADSAGADGLDGIALS